MQTTYRDKLKPAFIPGQDVVRKERETHAGLWLDKYIATQEKGDKGRQTFVEEVAALAPPKAYNLFYERWEKSIVESKAKTHKAHTKGRMAVGLGDESVLETSIALHHTYGVPYIPGSALKGLAANYAHQRLGNAWKKGSPAYKTVFGDTENAGYVVFFDALYIPGAGFKADPKNHDKNEQVLYPDILTVHHQAYYQGNENAAPADWDSPIPVPFLSATGSYLLALAAPDLNETEAWLTTTFQILANALSERGIGAKTSSGYGRMKIEDVDVIPTPTKEEEAQKPIATAQPSIPREYIRPKISKQVVDKLVNGKVRVVEPTDKLRVIAPEARAYLQLDDWPIEMVIVIIIAEEAAQWSVGQTRTCLYVSEEERSGCTVLVCKPGLSASKKKKKG